MYRALGPGGVPSIEFATTINLSAVIWVLIGDIFKEHHQLQLEEDHRVNGGTTARRISFTAGVQSAASSRYPREQEPSHEENGSPSPPP